MDKIKFGTDGWRAIIAKEFTVENVARVSEATGEWLLKNYDDPTVFVGHDCRFAGALFMETSVKVLLKMGLKVRMSEGFVSTPMVSLAAQRYNCQIGVVITASHNPPAYNGYKLKADFGGPLAPQHVKEVEDLIKDICGVAYQDVNFENYTVNGTLRVDDIETMYVEHVKNNFDLQAIQDSKMNLVYDAMYGAGQRVLPRILPNVNLLHCDYNPSFMGQAPEPIGKNLQELEQYIKTKENVECALATDGDADRIGMFNGAGEFIDSHHLILLLIHYLVKYKGQTGKIAIAFSVTPRVKKLCDHYGLEVITTKIGFKEIASIMVTDDVLVGGEESGGIAVKGHIPERDGIWMGLIIWEFMAKSGKSLDELIDEVYEIVNPFKFERSDLHITEELKQSIISNCKAGVYKGFGDYSIKNVETLDGFKYFIDDERWLMIRPSGTEPVLRVYAEAPTLEEVRKILKITEETICG